MAVVRTSLFKFLFFSTLALVGQTPETDTLLTQQQIQEDFDFLINFVENTHPKLSHTVNLKEYSLTKQEILESIKDMNTNKVWLSFARLNPIFNDAHLGLMVLERYPDTLNINQQIEIIGKDVNLISDHGKSKIKVLSIGDLDMNKFISTLYKVVRGESNELRNFVIQKRFSHYLNLFGINPVSESWVIIKGKRKEVTNWNKIFRSIGQKKVDNKRFEYESLGRNNGLMTIRSFEKDHLSEFEIFLKNSFNTIREKNIETLVIDVSENGGGSRELSDKLLSYLTAEKYTPTSKVTARVSEENINRLPQLKIGDTITLDYPQWADPNNDYVFKGKLFVKISEKTYSQAIVFSNIIQDFGIGTIIGQETGGKSNQTAQVQMQTLPNSGFKIVCPLYIFYRPKNTGANSGVIPDIMLPAESDKKALKRLICNN